MIILITIFITIALKNYSEKVKLGYCNKTKKSDLHSPLHIKFTVYI